MVIKGRHAKLIIDKFWGWNKVITFKFKIVITSHNIYVIGLAPSFSFLSYISTHRVAFHQTFFHRGILLNSPQLRGILPNNRYCYHGDMPE